MVTDTGGSMARYVPPQTPNDGRWFWWLLGGAMLYCGVMILAAAVV